MSFLYREKVKAEWIDYNFHMQDAYYGLVFSYAVDAFQNAVGFDADYRQETGCTIYLVEEHKYFLREVKKGDLLEVYIDLLAVTEKLFHLHCRMVSNAEEVAVSELVEMHVQQQPIPKGVVIPETILEKMKYYALAPEAQEDIARRSRSMSITRQVGKRA